MGPETGVALDPEIVAELARITATDPPTLSELTPRQARELYREAAFARRGEGYPPAVVDAVGDETLAGPAGPLAVRVYTPAVRVALTVIYLHGGGWVIGDLDTHDPACRALAAALAARVVSVDYRRAPEAPFPAALDDAFAALGWVAERWPVDRIAVAGDSAGGGLAAGCALRARDAARAGDDTAPRLAGQLLVYPALDPSLSHPSVQENREGYGLSRDDMRWFVEHYLPDPARRTDPAVALLENDDLAELAPAVIAVAGFDPLRDEGIAYADRLRGAGIPVRLLRFPTLIHGFFQMGAISPAADRAAWEIRRAFAATLGVGDLPPRS